MAKTIAASLVPEFQVQTDCRTFRTLARLLRSDLLIVHSPLGFSICAMLLAKLLGRPIIAFVWDLYPVRINGRRYDGRLRRKMADCIERFALWMSDHLIVQTEDFLSSPSLARAQVIPFWYVPSDLEPRKPVNFAGQQHLQFAFAGQINETRGLSEALLFIDKILNKRAILNIYSRDPFEPPDNLKRVEVRHCGYVTKEILAGSLMQHDVGLISLHPGFEGPAFPSKSLDYLAAGLPVVYFGPPLAHFSLLLETTGCGVTASASTQLNFDVTMPSETSYHAASALFFGRVRADPSRLKSHFSDVLGVQIDTSSAVSESASSKTKLE
ncbi:glycosyltransferase [Sulfitobacter geojensis]|uniref:Glycosyltransferase subfamily 4-like N-terminal domain-containing protein n=1 Tax=Sulfitobacter geojensis TaxID=1342299 RepID=A0AAE2VXS4_9RHOB|nr:glycosyltransferase [Sulfitobacter geojensis]MBM1689167.1 hypothetical protein [Sulfitobacter geojensis]MBM1693234.1 hypothetical protein [Sulfitobacter geojensis]MBM1705400.1 hypothetical protein [Sulfitobacter geojensis]MBM1709458.1 hypothetical protein [Sulfitobacter geojensis]MBM1713523.1 hypothetical protein [Sulfitobacter geojensis]